MRPSTGLGGEESRSAFDSSLPPKRYLCVCGCGDYCYKETRRIHFMSEGGKGVVEVVEWGPNEEPERLLDRLQFIAQHLGAPDDAISLPGPCRETLSSTH